MKLKEIPLSIYHTFKLVTLSSIKLKKLQDNYLPIIISLTSIPSRLTKVHITIRSVLNQSKAPNKVLLWLNEEDKNKIPNSLKILEGEVFEIRFTPLKCSHKKLIHTLEEFPEAIIVTCDDDFIYDFTWLEKIYNEHLEHPKAVIGNFTRQIRYNSNGELLIYKKWRSENSAPSDLTLAIGAAGILYPPKSLSPIVTNIDLALELTPKADDLWFKAMSYINKTIVLQSKNPPKYLIPIFGTQKVSLKKENVDNNKNLIQWEAITTYFKLKFI